MVKYRVAKWSWS